MNVQPYLFFDGRCDEALAFYKQAIGAQVEGLMRWKDCPDPGGCTEANKDKVMHASVKIGDATVMASDGRCEGKPQFQGFALSLTTKTEAELERDDVSKTLRAFEPQMALDVPLGSIPIH